MQDCLYVLYAVAETAGESLVNLFSGSRYLNAAAHDISGGPISREGVGKPARLIIPANEEYALLKFCANRSLSQIHVEATSPHDQAADRRHRRN